MKFIIINCAPGVEPEEIVSKILESIDK
jgi:hypothetical protein